MNGVSFVSAYTTLMYTRFNHPGDITGAELGLVKIFFYFEPLEILFISLKTIGYKYIYICLDGFIELFLF
jgi:hypothetical protein